MAAFDHVRIIVAQHRHRQSLRNPYRDELDDASWPAMTRAPSGREILFDQKSLAAIRDLAGCLRKEDPDLERSVGHGEWLKSVREKVAYALDISDPGAALDVSARDVLDGVMASLALSKDGLGQFEFAFGCSLFGGFVPGPICIGPVRFETRQDWLERKCAEGAISDTTRRRVLRTWEGQTPRKRRRSVGSSQEETILDLSRDASFLCSVSTNGLAHEFGRQLARTTARLALAVIALTWQSTSRALAGMNLVNDRTVRSLHDVTFRDGRPVVWGNRTSHLPPAVSAEAWDKLQGDFSGCFTVAGESLSSIVDVTTSPRRPNTTHALTHALLWFHQGCREDEPVIAVCNFAAALDCLTVGGCKNDIKELVKAVTGLKDEQVLWVREGQAIGQAIDEIYDHARNATMHGRKNSRNNWPDSKPFNDWNPGRDRAEILARICLLACMEWAAQHPDCDDPKLWRTSPPTAAVVAGND